MALEWSVLRLLANQKNPHDPTAVASALKIRGSELQQRVTELQTDLIGERALRELRATDAPLGTDGVSDPLWPPYVAGRMSTTMHTRAVTIYGGSKEIQKNIIAKLAFGL